MSTEAGERGPNAAWAACCFAVSTVIPERPWPPGLNRGTIGDWDFVLNAGKEPVMDGNSEIPGFGIVLTHREFFLIVVLQPSGGCIGGGMSEAEFIEQMVAIAPEAGEHV